ncbi:MAG: hypothetical protein NC244_05495 [Alistipes senegalensis]|nr:hypothetical protein [Alistipes senegalensis]
MHLDFDVIREILLYIEKETKYIETEAKEVANLDFELKKVYEETFGSTKELNSVPISLFKFVDEEKCSSISEALYILRKLEDGGYIITTESEETSAKKLQVFHS